MQVLRRILAYLRPYRGRMLIGYVALLVAIGMQLVMPRLVEYVVDDGLVRPSRHVVLLGALAIVGAGLLQGIFTYTRSYIFQYMSEAVSFDMRNDLYRKMQFLSFSFFDRANTGQLMSRATEDVNSIRRFLMMALRSIVQSVGMLVIITVVLLRADFRLALISLSVMPLLIVTAVTFGRTIRPRFLKVQQQFGVMTTTLQENLSGARVVRAFAREDSESERFDNVLTGLYQRQMHAVRLSSFSFALMTFLSSLGLALTLWYGGREVVDGHLSIGQLSAFYLYLSMLADPIRMLGWVVNMTARAMASGERIFEILDTRQEIQSPPAALVPAEVRGLVEFRDVSFRYPGSGVPALEEICLTARPGERIALIGGTGAGKSSVTALIPRFYDVSQGAVLVDGVDVRDWSLEALRSHIGMVLQDSFLFSVSLGENIAYGRPGASAEDVVEAARAARIHDFIASLPQGYDTVIGERGVSLSGGQKQRVAIARALLMDPRILILDDATSSVDTQTEYEIQQALQAIMRNRTTFVIAHRLMTLKQADQILVLDGGRVVERGTHESLLINRGRYAHIYDLQLKEQEEFAATAD